ncbi:MAG: hypothetical protein AAF416_19725, partial [Pseudomonadota bacterium]
MSGKRELSNGSNASHQPLGCASYTAGPDRELLTKGLSAELADKGFLLTSADDLINWARTGSLMWMTFGLAC